MLADSINKSLGNSLYYEYNRHDKHEKEIKWNWYKFYSWRKYCRRTYCSIFGEYETFEIKHTSYSRNLFAEGALKAADFIVTKSNGLYNMEDMFK